MQGRKKKDLLEKIQEVMEKTDNEILDFFREKLKDPYLNYSLEELKYLYDEKLDEKGVPDTFIKGLGFLIFTLAAEETNQDKFPGNSNETGEARQIADEILENLKIYDFIKEEYKIDDDFKEKPECIRFHKTGTTSFILQINIKTNESTISESRALALKILKYRYIDNKTINDNTLAYQQLYNRNFEFMPRVYQSGERYILMDFIDGMTLDEYMHSPGFKDSLHPDIIIKSIFLRLCDILKELGSRGIIHSDLNPKNIILENFTRLDRENLRVDEVKLSLIDFGVNYLLNEKIGSSRALTRARVYIAEEVLEDYDNTSTMSDIYSLGVILLELYNVNDRFEYREFDNYLDNIRLEAPVLASILDDILDKNPGLRLFDLQQKYSRDPGQLWNIYADLRRNLELEFKLLELKIKKKLNKFSRLALDVINLISFDFKAIARRRFVEAKEILNIRDTRRPGEYSFRTLTKRLGLWSYVGVVSHIFVLCIFIFFTRKYFNANQLKEKLPGLLVCMSFSFLALKYYLEIFSNIYPRYLGKLGWITNLWMRFGTFYWPPAILLAFYFDPGWWPYVSSYGTAVVVGNNFLCFMLAKKAEKKIEATFKQTISKNVKQQLNAYKFWWQLMLYYSAALLLLGIFLTQNILNDEWAYMVLALVINYKMYRYNCVKTGPYIRNMLQFYYSRYRRAMDLQRMKEGQSTPLT
jgi:serine/threonine protein kinase